MKNREPCTCVGCSKVIDTYQSPGVQGERAVEVRVGKVLESQSGRRGRPRINSDKFKHESTWGLMHFDCFLKAIEAPDPAFAVFGG